MKPNGRDHLTALLEKGMLLCWGHGIPKTRPGKVSNKTHFLSNAGKSTGQWNTTVDLSGFILLAFTFRTKFRTTLWNAPQESTSRLRQKEE